MRYRDLIEDSSGTLGCTDTCDRLGAIMRILCPGCGRTTVAGRCPNCGKPPMTSQLKWALLALVAIIVLAVMAMRGGDSIDPSVKKPAAAAPAR
jgi:hypothetical protein